MKELLDHPWVKVLLIATTVAMCSVALRETASITLPVVQAVYDVLVPVAIAFVIAYVLTPIIDLISKRVGFGRAIATGVLFAATALVGVGATLLIVPAMVREGAELADQAARGEPFTDLDGDGRRSDDEPFVDRNANGRHDPALVSQIGAWVEERQHQARRMANLEVDHAGLALLLRYDPEAAAAADPAALRAVRSRWIATARVLRSPAGADTASTEAVEAIRKEGKDLGPARRAEAQRVLRELEVAEQAGDGDAHKLLVELRGGEGGAGAKALAAGIAGIEKAVRTGLDETPARIGGWLKDVFTSANVVLGLAVNALLIPIYAFFLVLAMPAIRSTARDFIPAKHKDSTLRIIREIERAVSAFFRGRLIICTVCAIVGVIGFLVIGLFGTHVPYGVLWGMGIGLVTVLPLAGLLLLIPAIALTMIQPGAGTTDIVLVIGVYALVQGVEMVLIPIVLGREVELHPVILIIALLLCGKLLGVLGVIMAVPIAATARILNREFLWPRLKAWAAKGVDAVQPPPPDSASSTRIARSDAG